MHAHGQAGSMKGRLMPEDEAALLKVFDAIRRAWPVGRGNALVIKVVDDPRRGGAVIAKMHKEVDLKDGEAA